MRSFYKRLFSLFLPVCILCILHYHQAEACVTPKPEITGSDTACENSLGIYGCQFDGGKKYKWEITNGKYVKLDFKGYRILWDKPGIGTITINAYDNHGCPFTSTKTVVIKPSDNKKFDAGPDVYACEGEMAFLSVDSVPGHRYEWGDLRYYHGVFVSNRPFHRFIAKGIYGRPTTSYPFLVTQIDISTGCRYYDTVNIIIYSLHKTKITGESGCLNDSTIYTYTTDSLPFNGRWEIHGGKLLTGNREKSVKVKWNRIGKNYLALKYFTGNCKDSTIVETALSKVKAPFYAGPDVVACEGDPIILGMQPIPNCTYLWHDTRDIDFGGKADNTKSYLKNPVLGNVKTDLEVYFKVTLTDTFSGCKFIDTVKLTVKPRLKANITGTVGCYNQVATFTTDLFMSGAYWVAEGGEIISDNKAKTVFVRWNRNGKNAVILRYNYNDCPDSAMFLADVDSLTYFPISGADSIFENTQHTYTSQNLNNNENKWIAIGGEIVSETENTVTILWGNKNPEAKIFSYKINENGCRSDSAILPIHIKRRDNLDLSQTFHLYPNPFNNYIWIAPVNDFSGEVTIVLTDMPGRKIFQQIAYIPFGKNAFRLDISSARLKPGFYNLSIISNQNTSTWKLVKE